jgi:5-methylcytosine-specific restriction protein A
MGKPYVIANTVDHRVPISEGGHAFPGHDGLASYCAGCHSAKTARGPEAGAARSNKPRRGCDAEGNPLDPAHPWKSLIADQKIPWRDMQNQLVSKGNRNGR